MCGRYALFALPEDLVERFHLENGLAFHPRYNVAPSQANPVIQQSPTDGRIAFLAKWGLIPSWAKDPKMAKPFNATVETAATSPMFRSTYRKQRILVPVSGFYEWKAVPAGAKQPYFIRMADGEPFAFGGILEHWQGPDGLIVTYAILTTAANALVRTIHNRMPVIVAEKDWTAWLAPTITDPEAVRPLTGPYPSELMDLYPVSRRVNKPAEDNADLIAPA